MTVTANTIIRDALAVIGAIGKTETPEPEDAGYSLRNLNRMLDAWAIKRLYAYCIAWQTIALPAATETRTIGPSGQVNVARPVRAELGGYVRLGGIDFPLEILTREEWASIPTKTLAGAWPTKVYYEAASPLGILHFWPQGACDVYLPIQTRLSAFADLSTAYTLPPGYEDAIVLSLAERECLPNQRPVSQWLAASARAAREAIKAANFETPMLDVASTQPYGMAAFLGG